MALELNFRRAAPEDALTLAPMNKRLIEDEGHRNPMSVEQLAERMRGWLREEYEAYIAQCGPLPVAYCLYRRSTDHVYIRQLFVERNVRKSGVGRCLLEYLKQTAWKDAPCLRMEVLLSNPAGMAFWRRVGFLDYCITMECQNNKSGQ